MVGDSVSEESVLSTCNQCGDRLPDGLAGHTCWLAWKLMKVDGLYLNQENLQPPIISEFVATRPALDDNGQQIPPR